MKNIRAVILNGSRANPNRKPDLFNDFDIVYLVRDLTRARKKPIIKTSAKSSSVSAPTKASF